MVLHCNNCEAVELTVYVVVGSYTVHFPCEAVELTVYVVSSGYTVPYVTCMKQLNWLCAVNSSCTVPYVSHVKQLN